MASKTTPGQAADYPTWLPPVGPEQMQTIAVPGCVTLKYLGLRCLENQRSRLESGNITFIASSSAFAENVWKTGKNFSSYFADKQTARTTSCSTVGQECVQSVFTITVNIKRICSDVAETKGVLTWATRKIGEETTSVHDKGQQSPRWRTQKMQKSLKRQVRLRWGAVPSRAATEKSLDCLKEKNKDKPKRAPYWPAGQTPTACYKNSCPL